MKILFYCIAAIICCNTFSQSYDNNWVFGDSAALQFTSGEPVSYISGMTAAESCASISDSSGNLLFYTNGENVWNKEHEVMPNGDSLEIGKISLAAEGSSITQGVIIIPKPGANGLYYIFQMQYPPNYSFGLEYTLIDMTLDGGKGDIVEKNIHFYSDTTDEKMHAVKHANGIDWWLILRQRSLISSDTETYTLTFVKFLIKPDGVSEPIYQFIEPDWEYFTTANWGQMIFSEDGNKMAYATGGYETSIYDFDRCTGEFSNYVKINTGSYGLSFSPNASKLYLNYTAEKKLYQFCLDCGEPIDSTKTLIYYGPEGNYGMGQHLLGPDGKIYISTVYNTLPNEVYNSKNQNLCVINKPDLLFPTCDFDTNTVSIFPRRVQELGLPNMPNYNLGALSGSGCDTLGVSVTNIETQNEEIRIYPNPAGDYFYIDGNIAGDVSFDIKVYAADGKEKLSFDNVHLMQALNISTLVSGIYQVQVMKSDKTKEVIKLITLKPDKK